MVATHGGAQPGLGGQIGIIMVENGLVAGNSDPSGL